MYFKQEQDYISEPIDQISESSYIKINKKFLQTLKQANQIDDLSRFRPDSIVSSESQDHEEQDHEGQQSSDQEQIIKSQHQQKYERKSPIKSNFHKIFYHSHEYSDHQSSMKLSDSKKQPDQEDKLQQYFQRQKEKEKLNSSKKSQVNKASRFSNEKLSKISNREKKEINTPLDNTFQYYLMRKNHQRKYKDHQNMRQSDSVNNIINQMQTQPIIFSPKNRISNRSQEPQHNQKQQIQRINYKKLLQNEISKNKQLEKNMYILSIKLNQLTIEYDQSFKSSKKLEKDLINSEKIRKQNKQRMKELDGKLEGLKEICRGKNSENQNNVKSVRKENKILKEENQKYRVFVETLAESIFVLKGRKPKKLEDLWDQWRTIFESFSKNKWTPSRIRSPNTKI